MRLQDKAVLVKFSSGMPGNTRKDIKITADTQARYQMGAKAGRWIKQLFPDEALAPCAQIKNEFYTWLGEHTLEWPDEGLALLPSLLHFDVCQKEREFKTRWESAVQTFFANWEKWIEWGKKEHNGTFDATQYNESKARRAFKFKVEFRPIPESSQYAQDISALIGSDATEVDAMVQEATTSAMNALWQRLREPLAHMVDFLGSVEGKERTRFCESLLSNIRDIVKLIPALNIGQDKQLADFAAQIESAIAGLSIDALKDSKSTREETARKAQEILKAMDGYFPQNSTH